MQTFTFLALIFMGSFSLSQIPNDYDWEHMLRSEPEQCLRYPNIFGYEKIFDIGSNQVTAKNELERLAIIRTAIVTSDSRGYNALAKIMGLVREAYDNTRSGNATNAKKDFVDRYTNSESGQLSCDKRIQYNEAVEHYLSYYQLRP